MNKRLVFILFLCILASGCGAKNYYPLKNELYMEGPSLGYHKVAVMPFYVDVYHHYSAFNTTEKRDEKAKDAREFIIEALKSETGQSNYRVTDYISYDEYVKDDYDREKSILVGELYEELDDADYSIQENLEQEQGRGFDYSIGVKSGEMAGHFRNDPDVLMFLMVNAYVENLTALESNAMNAAAAVLSFGMSKVVPTPDDITYMEMTLVDAKSGDIMWIDVFSGHGKSILRQSDMHFMIQGLMRNLFAYRGKAAQ